MHDNNFPHAAHFGINTDRIFLSHAKAPTYRISILHRQQQPPQLSESLRQMLWSKLRRQSWRINRQDSTVAKHGHNLGPVLVGKLHNSRRPSDYGAILWLRHRGACICGRPDRIAAGQSECQYDPKVPLRRFEHGARYAVGSRRSHPQISMQYTSINAAEQPPHTGQHCRTSEIDATSVGCRIVICFSFHPQCAFKG